MPGHRLQFFHTCYGPSHALTGPFTDNDNSTDADGTAVGGNSDALSLSKLSTADEAWYYCKAANAGVEWPHEHTKP